MSTTEQDGKTTVADTGLTAAQLGTCVAFWLGLLVISSVFDVTETVWFATLMTGFARVTAGMPVVAAVLGLGGMLYFVYYKRAALVNVFNAALKKLLRLIGLKRR